MPGRSEETVRHAVEFRFGENDRRLHFDDVRVEIGPEFGKFLAQLLDFLALLRRQIEPGPPIIAQCFLEQLRVFAAQFRLRFFERLDRLVNVLAVIDADRPILEDFHRVLAGRPHGGGSCSFP